MCVTLRGESLEFHIHTGWMGRRSEGVPCAPFGFSCLAPAPKKARHTYLPHSLSASLIGFRQFAALQSEMLHGVPGSF